mmetsp:Transcript_32331/g.72984  ORF Transcript_32331/g.72984 Transcript_32331/m.72984 type:complete len:117 (-) Transcript_32331:443-793(-)
MTDRVAPLLPEHGSLLEGQSWQVSPPPAHPVQTKPAVSKPELPSSPSKPALSKLTLPTSPSAQRTPLAANSPRSLNSASHAGSLSARRRNRSLARLVLAQGAGMSPLRPSAQPASG